MTKETETIDTSDGHVHTRDRFRADVIRDIQDLWDRAIEIDDAADAVIDLLYEAYEIERQEPGCPGISEGWKLVPVEPTAEMGDAAMNAEDYSNRHRGEPASFIDIWDAMLAAAPAVQGEPVFMWHRGATDDESEVVDVDCACPCCVPLYAAPQPAEQQPSDYPDHPGWTGSADCITAMALLERLDTDNDGRVEQIRALIGRIGADVDRLVEALELAQGFLRNKGYPEEDPLLLGAINAALAAHRKGGE